MPSKEKDSTEELVFKQYFTPFTTIKAIHYLVIIGMLLYAASLFNGFVADDNIYILQNPQITNFNYTTFLFGSSYYSGDVTNLGGIYYKPIFTFAVSLLYKLSGGTPFLFHLVQLVLHIINASLVLLLFKRFFSLKLAFFLSTVFLVHPANTESVVYIANMQEPLYFIFGMSALLFVAYSKQYIKKNAAVIGVLLLFALLSKETGALFLPATVLFVFLHQRKRLLPTTFLVSGVFAFYLFLRFVIGQVSINHQAISPIMEASLDERLLTIPKIVYSYFLLFLFPKDLSWGHQWVVTTPTMHDFYIPLSVIFVLLLIFVIFYLKIKNKDTKHSLLFFLGISVIGLALHSQIIPLDFTFADRWIYFPIVGFIGLFGVLFEHLTKPKRFYLVFLIFAVVIISSLAARSFIRSLDWKSDYSLTSHDIQVDPNSFVLHNNLGYVLLHEQKYDEAAKHFVRALELYPTQSTSDNLAHTYSKLGKGDKAIETYEKSLAQGEYYMTYQNYAAELLRQKKLPQAKTVIEKGLKSYPNNPTLYLLFAVYEYKSGEVQKAIDNAQRANYLSPHIADLVLSKIAKNEPIEL